MVHRGAAGLQAGREWPPGAARGGKKAAGAPHSAGAARPSRSCPTRGIAAAPRVLTGEKNEKKRVLKHAVVFFFNIFYKKTRGRFFFKKKKKNLKKRFFAFFFFFF